MLKSTISRAAFFAVMMTTAPAFANDITLSKSVDALSQQVQEQQKQIDMLMQALKDKQQPIKKKVARKAQPETYTPPTTAPGVVAPLQPSVLGAVSQAPVSVPMGSYQQNIQPSRVLVAPRLLTPEAMQAAANARTQTQQVQLQAPQLLPATVPASTVAQAYSTPSAPVPAAPATTTTAYNRNIIPGHVGEAPPQQTKAPEVQALANVGGVLTPYGKVVVEPFLQYSRSSVNSFVFEGVQVVSSLLIGAVEANKTSRDLVTTGATFRLGVSDRMEIEARVPYVWRQDSLTNTITNTNNTTTANSNGYGLGDLEAAVHYQINDGLRDWPFFIGNFRFKSDTGSSPYNSQYNTDGTPHTLATGSGFMAVEPSITAIYPSDPATLFANLGYIHSFGEKLNHNVGNAFVNEVQPGDTISGSMGMGIALNDKLSFTVGYEHDYVRPTETTISGVKQTSPSLQVGSALSGISYRVNDRTSINVSLAAGVTKDAPDAVISLRVPVMLQVF